MGTFTFETLQSQKDFQYVSKSADQTINNQSTLEDDDELFVELEINTPYFFWCHVYLTSAANADLDVTFTAPTGFTSGRFYESSGNNTVTGQQFGTRQFAATAAGVAGMRYSGFIVTGTTVGNLQFQFAQDVAQMSDLVILQGSTFQCFRGRPAF